MDYNPFDAMLRAAEDDVSSLEQRRAGLAQQVDWATRFDRDGAIAEITHLRSDVEDHAAELRRLEERVTELDAELGLLASRTRALEDATRIGLNVLRWFSVEHDDAKARLKAHRQEMELVCGLLQDADRDRRDASRKLERLTDAVSVKERDLARFTNFNSVEVAEALAETDRELALRRREREAVRARKESVDRAVAAPLSQLRGYQSELEEHESAVSRLRSEVSTLEHRISEAERIDEELSDAANSYERAMLHQECQRRFGEGSPRAAVRAIRLQMRSVSGDIGDHQRQIDRIRRDSAKTEQRIRNLAQVAARDVRELVIDGSNCCYEGNEFIGLAALIRMVEDLGRQYPVTVVFDAGIRGLLGVGDEDLRAALPAVTVHVVASRVKADETILDTADDPTVWVISNDRFGDFRDKTCVRERRLIRHEILHGRVLVHDLGVDVLWR